MADFFSGEQVVTLLHVQAKGGEATGKLKVIRIKMAIDMNSDSKGSAPDWASEAQSFVLKSKNIVRPPHEFEAMDMNFSVDELFSKGVKGHSAKLHGFELGEGSGGEDPDVLVVFTAEVAYAGPLWKWLGEHIGEDVYAKFEQVVEAPKPAEGNVVTQMSLAVN